MLNKIITFSLLVTLVFVGYQKLEEFGLIGPTVCERTLKYSLGRFDDGFNVTKAEFLDSLREAEVIWEKRLGKNMFLYDQDSEFKINLIFDERQNRFIEESAHREELEVLGSSYEKLSTAHLELKKEYDIKNAEYKSAISVYEERLDRFNTEVKKWNSRGGAPKGTYESMQKEEEELRLILAELDRKRIALNELVKNLNLVGKTGSTVAGQYNAEVGTYKAKYGSPREFSQGDYSGNRINIYQFDDKSHLTLILAHELGHALNLKHVENPHSIMYYLMEAQDISNPTLTQEDIEALKTECRIK